MDYEQTKANIKASYDLINEEPTDRLDCISKAIKILVVLNGGAVFLNEVATSPHVHEFSAEELSYIHESFCDSAAPIIEMIEYFTEKMEKETAEHTFAV